MYFQSEPNFNGFYSGTNYVKIKNGGYLISLYEYKLESTHWTDLHVNRDNGQDLTIQPIFSTLKLCIS